MQRKIFCLLLYLVFLLSSCSLSDGIIVTKTFSMEENTLALVQRFGFVEGGTSHFEISGYSPSYARLDFLMCDDEEYSKLVSAISSRTSYCQGLFVTYCTVSKSVELTANNTSFVNDYTSPIPQTLSVVIGNCHSSSKVSDIKTEYTMKNGANHLSSAYIPLPSLYGILFYIWCGLIAIWLLNWIRFFRQSIRLHQLMITVPITKLGFLGLTYRYWSSLAETGIDDSPVYIISFVMFLFFEFTLYGTLILIAKGWCLIRADLDHQERRSILFVLLILTTGSVLKALYEELFLFAVLILYIIVLRMIFSSVTANTHLLNMQLRYIRNAGIDPSTTPVYDKFRMYRVFATVMTAYVCVKFLILGIDVLFLTNMSWVTEAMSQILDIGVVVGVFYVFRLRDFSPYWDRAPESNENRIPPVIPSDSPLSEEEMQSDGLVEWHMGMPLPRIPHSQSHPQQIVVIQTPGSKVDENGKVVPMVGISAAVPVSNDEDGEGVGTVVSGRQREESDRKSVL